MWQTRLPREMCVDESVLEICSVLWMSLSFELLMYMRVLSVGLRLDACVPPPIIYPRVLNSK